MAGAKAIQDKANCAGKRLLAHRPPLSCPKGTTVLDFLDFMDQLVRDANRNGVFLTKRERECLRIWHMAKRIDVAMAETKARYEEAAAAEAKTDQEP